MHQGLPGHAPCRHRIAARRAGAPPARTRAPRTVLPHHRGCVRARAAHYPGNHPDRHPGRGRAPPAPRSARARASSGCRGSRSSRHIRSRIPPAPRTAGVDVRHFATRSAAARCRACGPVVTTGPSASAVTSVAHASQPSAHPRRRLVVVSAHAAPSWYDRAYMARFCRIVSAPMSPDAGGGPNGRRTSGP